MGGYAGFVLPSSAWAEQSWNGELLPGIPSPSRYSCVGIKHYRKFHVTGFWSGITQKWTASTGGVEQLENGVRTANHSWEFHRRPFPAVHNSGQADAQKKGRADPFSSPLAGCTEQNIPWLWDGLMLCELLRCPPSLLHLSQRCYGVTAPSVSNPQGYFWQI